MIDPFNITNYSRTDSELEAFALFCVAVAGKSAETTDRAFDKLWKKIYIEGKYVFSTIDQCGSPFMTLAANINSRLVTPETLRDCGFGCYNHRFESFKQLVSSGINLRTCTVDDLEKIKGIGRKTSRFFLLHSRKDFKGAVIDTHVLKFLKERGVDTPKSTPASAKKYRYLENEFIWAWMTENICREKAGAPRVSLAEFDLFIWKSYTKGKPYAKP